MRDIKKILLWGGGSQARIIESMILEQKLGQPIAIFDSSLSSLSFESTAEFIHDAEVLCENLSRITHFITCIGNEHGYARHMTTCQLQSIGIKPISIIHPHAYIEKKTEIGIMPIIMPGAIVHKFCTIGDSVILNTNSTIDHECTIGDGVHIMGSAAISGRVTIENYATIGTNATILPNIFIGEGSFIGAGSVVTHDIPPYSVYAGVPAKLIRNNVLNFNSADLVLINRKGGPEKLKK
ncbi:MAG: acetyltransferase [Pseudomonadota bacterium]